MPLTTFRFCLRLREWGRCSSKIETPMTICCDATSEGGRDFLVSVGLDQIARLDVLVALEADAAIEAGEVPDQPYRELLPRLFWDYMSGVLAYWLRDRSEGFANTTQLVDRSMVLVANVIEQGLVGKVIELFAFLMRTHFLSQLGHLQAVATEPSPSTAKRPFMRNRHER